MNTKKELKTFFTWLRNGTCFAVTWFLILELIVRWISGADTISIVNLTKTIVWTVGGVLIFCAAFTRLFIRRFGFTARLTIFTSACSAFNRLYHPLDYGIIPGFGNVQFLGAVVLHIGLSHRIVQDRRLCARFPPCKACGKTRHLKRRLAQIALPD